MMYRKSLMMMTWEGMTITMMMMMITPLDGNPPNVLTRRAMMGSLPPEKSVFVSTDPQSIGRNVVEGCHH